MVKFFRPTPLERVASALRARRISVELTQDDVAVYVGVARSSISNFEAGRQDMPFSKVADYAKFVGLRIVLLDADYFI